MTYYQNSSAGSESEPVGWCPWHPEKGFDIPSIRKKKSSCERHIRDCGMKSWVARALYGETFDRALFERNMAFVAPELLTVERVLHEIDSASSAQAVGREGEHNCDICGGAGYVFTISGDAKAPCPVCNVGDDSEILESSSEVEPAAHNGPVAGSNPASPTTTFNDAQAAVVPDPFNRKQVEAVCRAVCNVEGLDPDDAEWTGGDPPWTRYADAVASALASQPSPAATVNKKTRCESCNLLEPCADPQCPNSLTRSSAGNGDDLSRRARELADEPVIGAEGRKLLRQMAAEIEDLRHDIDRHIQIATGLLNEPQSVKVTDLSSRQLALAGEYVKEGHPMEDAIRMAHEAGDPK